MSLSSRVTRRMYRMREGNVHGRTQLLATTASKCCRTLTIHVNDESQPYKILHANHLHKNLPHNKARRLESSHPACQLKPPSDVSSGGPSPPLRSIITLSGRQLKSRRGPGFNLLNMFYFVLREIFFRLIIFSWIACNKSSPKQPLFCL
jgi:hypothetical protein